MKHKVSKKIYKNKSKDDIEGLPSNNPNACISGQQPLVSHGIEVAAFSQVTTARHLDINKLLREKYGP